jgi:hypothetical protein
MAADTEREQEAREWYNAYFGPAHPDPVQTAVFDGLNYQIASLEMAMKRFLDLQ